MLRISSLIHLMFVLLFVLRRSAVFSLSSATAEGKKRKSQLALVVEFSYLKD